MANVVYNLYRFRFNTPKLFHIIYLVLLSDKDEMLGIASKTQRTLLES